MNDFQQSPVADAGVQSRTDPRSRETDRPASEPGPIPTKPARRTGRRLLAAGALLLLCAALGVGFWRHSRLHAQVMATAEQRRDFVPSVRTAPVRVSASTMAVTWPGTTEAFEQANIYARASGYISRREVDIGSRVKAGQLLVAITAPELEHQIAQAEGTLAQMQAALRSGKSHSRPCPGHVGSRQSPRSERLGYPATRRHRSLDSAGEGRRCRGRRGEYHRTERAIARAEPAKGLPERGRAV